MFEVIFDEDGGAGKSFSVKLESPKQRKDDLWVCPAVIFDKSMDPEADASIKLDAPGENPLQAIFMTMTGIRKFLDDNGEFSLDGDPIWSAIPRQVPYQYGGAVVKEIEGFIDQKVTEWNHSIEKRFGL